MYLYYMKNTCRLSHVRWCRRAPPLGERTAQILSSDLGLSEHQIKDLHERGVVASASPER